MKLVPRETQTVVDPRTGVMFPIEEVKDDLLVEIFTELEAREKQYQEWRRMAEDELVRRRDAVLDEYSKDAWQVGTRHIEVDHKRTRTWDATELQMVVEDLVERGLLSVKDATGLLIDQEPKVDGNKAVDLLNRTEGDALMELRRCSSWKQGRPRVKVTPTAHIEP